MIAADTSSMVAYFGGKAGADVDKVVAAIPRLGTLEIHDGYWIRAARLRRCCISGG